MKTRTYKVIKFLIRRFGKNISKYLIDFSSFGFWYMISSFLALIINVLINYSLEPIEYGKYSYNRSILELSASVLSLNIYASYLRFNVNGVSIVLKKYVCRITVIALLLLGAIVLYLTRSLLALPYILFLLYNERSYMARSVMDIKSVSVLRVGACLMTLFILSLLFYTKNTINSNIVLSSLGIGYALSLFFYNQKYREVDDKGVLSLKQILLFVLPSATIIIVNWLINLSGQVFIKHAYGYVDVANYAIAQRIISIIKLVSSMFMMFYPVVYFKEMNTKNYASVHKIRKYIIFLMTAITLFAFVFSKQLYCIMGASKYSDYIIYFNILLFSEWLFTISSFYAQYLAFVLKTHITLIICSVGAFINLAILYLFLNRYGVITAAYAVLISNIVMSIFYFFLSYRKEKEYMCKNQSNDR